LNNRCMAIGVLAATLLVTACATTPPSETISGALACVQNADARYEFPGATSEAGELDLAALGQVLKQVRVTFVGERHTTYGDHLNQLAALCTVVEADSRVMIGLEAVQWPFQSHLDDYVAGRIDLDKLLVNVEYYDRWRYDFRLYEPIFELARRRGLRLVALNAPAELTRMVARKGIAGLSVQEQAMLPTQMDRSSASYRARLEAVFSAHGAHGSGVIDYFVDAQRVWDETMADKIAGALEERPGSSMVVLAGVGHVGYENSVAQRLARRTSARSIVLVPSAGGAKSPFAPGAITLGDVDLSLQPTGRLGVYLDSGVSPNGVRILRFAQGSAAQAAGLRAGDFVTAIAGRTIGRFEAVKLALRNSEAGQSVLVEVTRVAPDGARRFEREVVLN
jgi:uncharacterized iron-regulated protein